MREMKDSGIEWIGKIPADWTRAKIKNICFLIGSGTTPTSHNQDYYKEDINWIQSGDLYGTSIITDTQKKISTKTLDSFTALKIYKPPFISIAMYGASVGNLAISTIKACCNQAVCCLKTNENIVTNNFLFYWLTLSKTDFLSLAEGGTQPNISQQKIKNQYIYIPLLEEQQKIADFLDKKCSEIDALSTDIQTQIDTLDEYKKSIINEAVTKGLNPNVEMKDSNAKWLGMIPSHWKVEKLKYSLRRNDVRKPGDHTVLSLYREYGVIPKDSRDDNHNVTSEDTSKYKYVRVGDFVVNKMKAWQGSVGVSDYQGIVSPAYYVYNFLTNEINRRYFHYLIRSNYKHEFRRLSGGIREGQWDLSSEALDNTAILIPPYSEQEEIAVFLDKKCIEIEKAISEKQQQLETLEEYKKSLIYEYVTGKKEIA